MRFFVGFDLSFTSPACAIYDTKHDRWFLSAFAQLKREIGFWHQSKNVEVKLFPQRPDASSDVTSYLHIESHFFAWLTNLIPPDARAKEDTIVCLEAYAFAAPEKSGYNFKLHELGGIIKRQLHLNGFYCADSVVNTSWKANVVGHGFASKIDVVHYIANNGPCIHLLDIFHRKESDLSLDDKGRPIIPSPCQDLADASAIVLHLLHPPTKKKQRPKKKRLRLEQVPLPPPRPTKMPPGFLKTVANCDLYLDMNPNDDDCI